MQSRDAISARFDFQLTAGICPTWQQRFLKTFQELLGRKDVRPVFPDFGKELLFFIPIGIYCIIIGDVFNFTL
jgi:hypothetical protein